MTHSAAEAAMDKPKVLIIGDSISMHYTPYVAKLLADRYAVAHNDGNAGDSRNILRSLDAWLAADGDAELIHFNCGLHDIKIARDTGRHQVPIGEYRRNLTEIASTLKASGKKLIWATCTPVIFERHRQRKEFDRREDDVQAYNAAALEIVSAAGIAVDDLHEIICRAGAESCLDADGVHMTDKAGQLLGEAVAEAIIAGMEGEFADGGLI